MRITVLRTLSNSCVPIYDWLHNIATIDEIIYDQGGHLGGKAYNFALLPAEVNDLNPDWVLMLGQCDLHGAPCPPDDVLKSIHSRHKLVHLCCDGSAPDWFPQIERYRNIFDLQINIDGVAVGPFAKHGMTTLCPIDPAKFNVVGTPWIERPISLGFRGGYGLDRRTDARSKAIFPLVEAGLVHAELRLRPDQMPPTHDGFYDEYCTFMTQCKCIWNHAGSGNCMEEKEGDNMHVKARVLEAAFAGCVLFENAWSPTRHWFGPDIDYYIPYTSVDDIKDGLRWVQENPEDAEDLSQGFRKTAQKYSAEKFWNRVIASVAV